MIKKVKSELSQCLKERESLNSNWINLVLDNISSDIMNQKIHSFYNFFNSLINNLILKQEHLKEFTINELVQYFEEIIELVIKNNFEQILEQNINAKNENKILEFIKNPNEYLFKKIKEYVNKTFQDTIDESTILKLSQQFLPEFNEIANKFIDEIIVANKILLKNELEKKIDEYLNNLTQNVVHLCNKNCTYINSFELSPQKEHLLNTKTQ